MKKRIFLGLIIVLFLCVTIFLQGAIPAQERAALIALYNSTNGDSWTDNSGWKTPPLDTDGFAMPGTESGWYGIIVEADQVIRIILLSNQLSGSIPSELGNLSNLQELYLYGSQLSGSIPSQLSNLQNLRVLVLSINHLTGSIPSELSNLSNLITLSVYENQLTGSIPSELGNLSNLQGLILCNNQLSGSIPSELGNLSNLTNISLYNNQLSGGIPLELANLSKLIHFYLHENQLSGSIPSQIGNLSNLYHLNLSGNHLSGDIPSSFTNLTNMTDLDVGYNCLSATDPTLRTWLDAHDPDWESNQTNCMTITVTSPNGGEIWLIGSTHDITWTSSGTVGNVQIESSSDNGANWTEITASTENDGAYSWSLPTTASVNYLVRVSETDGNPTDISDAVFTISEGITGRVIDELGNGIANVQVQAYTFDSMSYVGAAATDADGNYAISGITPGNYKICFSPPNGSNYIYQWYNNKNSSESADPVTITAGQIASGINAQLVLGGAVSGRVIDESGSGILNIHVGIYSNNSSYWDSTDADGYYTVRGIPAGNCTAFFYTAYAGNYIQEWYNDKNSQETADTLNVTPGQTLGNIDAQLVAGSIISGRVTNVSGDGIANVQAMAGEITDNLWYSGTSDANGYYSVTGLKPGSYKVDFNTQNAGNYIQEWYNDKDNYNNADTILLAAKQTIGNIDAQLAEGGIVSGRVIDESGNGIKNIEIDIFNLNHANVAASVTDSNGDYSVVGIPAGDYVVSFSGYHQNYIPEYYNDKATFETADQITVTVGQTMSGIDAQLALGGMISGRVTDINGNGIANVSANVHNQNNEILHQHCHTDSQGYYTIYGIPAGSYKVDFTCYGMNYLPEWYNDKSTFETADPIIVTVGQTTPDINAQLTQGGVISGTVTDESGNPLADIRVQARTAAYSTFSDAYTDAAGHYSIQGLLSGSYKIYFSNNGQNYLNEWYNNKSTYDSADPVNATVGQTTPGIDAQLAQGGTITGHVTDFAGNPIPGASILVFTSTGSPSQIYVYADANGDYIINGLPTGNWRLFFEAYPSNFIPGFYNHKTTFDTADPIGVIVGQTTSGIDMQLAVGGIVSGRVTDESGNGIAGVTIRASNPDLWYNQIGYTDEDGYYSVIGLSTGNYKVKFEKYDTGYFITEWYNNKSTQADADVLNVTAGQTTGDINAQLGVGGIVSGRVIDVGGNGIPNVYIHILNLSNQTVASAYTGSDGNYSTYDRIPVGNYKVHCDPQSSGAYLPKYYNNKNTFADGDTITVTANQTLTGIDFQLETGGVISGRVTNDSGAGIAGVGVTVYNTNSLYVNSSSTDANGDYQVNKLDTGNYKVFFSTTNAGNYIQEYYNDKAQLAGADLIGVVKGQTTPGIDAVLASGGILAGRVTDESGIGIQNVRVRLYDANGRGVSLATTDSSGNYTRSSIMPGSYRVYFDTTNVSGNYVAEYYNDKFILSRADTINIISGQTTTIDAILSPGGIISGQITDTGGNGIANVYVSVRNAYNNGQYKYKYTDNNGNYTIQGIPTSLCKVYFNTDNTAASYVSEWYNDKTDSYYAQVFNITPGQTYSGINAILASGGIISGRITNASTGSGIAEMEVYVYGPNGNPVDAYGYSDENGDYMIKGLATGNYKINFDTYYYNQYYSANYVDQWYNDKYTLPTADSVAVTAGQTTSGINAPLTTGGGTISGRVTDENGVGIANTTVYVEKDWTDVDYWDGKTDADGNYQVTGITAGTYHVYFLSPITPVSYAPQIYNGKAIKNGPEEEGDWVQVTNGGVTPNIDAILSPAGTVTGRVVDGSGNGIQNIRVRLYDTAGNSFAFINATTDFYGYYTITRVPPGQMKAYFSSSDVLGGNYRCVFYNNKQSLTDADTFTVQAGITTADINAVMTAGGGTISGYVRLKNGQAINGAVIKLYDITGPYSLLSQVSSNSNGYFEFKGLLPGMYKLSASCKSIYATEWYNEKATHTAANAITVTEGGAAQVEITLGETAALQVTSPNGGEVWDAGSLHAITWTNAGPVGDVKIEYSIDNGLNWIEIVSAIENTGDYNWTVPAAPSPNCKVRISGPGGVPSDVSDAVFTIFSNPAGWVPVIGMQNNMVVYGKAYYGITEAAAGDWLGAFGPGGVSDCRGVALVGANGNYYITIRSDASSGETITFKLWPNPSGPAIDAGETIEFISDNIYADLPLHFGPRTQNIPMMAGWNWIAFNTLPADASLNSVFAAILGSVEQVKSQTQAAVYSGGTWIGDLTDMSGIADGIMYKVKTTQTCTLSANGLTISFNKPLPLVLGWNWTAYLPMLIQPVETALNSIMTPLNQVKSQTQSAVKVGDGLIGDLTQMEPNKGYTIKTTAPGVLIYPYGAEVSADQSERSGGTSAGTSSGIQALPWKTIKGNQYNMVAFGKVYLAGEAVAASGYYLVSDGPNGEGDCRSVSPIGTDGHYFSTILGNTNGEAIKFKLYDSINHKTYDIVGSTKFQSDDLKSDYNLTARSIKVTAPGGGEKLYMGSICNIAWEAYEVNNVKIELYKNGKSFATIISSISSGTHTYSWTIPARIRAGNNYQIKVSAVDPGVRAEDTSNTFSIVPLTALTLNYPVGAEVLQVKRSYDITWGSSGIDNIKIELYKGAAINTVIAANTPAAAGKYTWTVPVNQALGSDYKIKISSVDAGINLSDTSKSAFTIAAYKNTAADFDGDGKADLVWRYYGTGGYNCIWLSGAEQGSDPIDDARLAPQAITIQDESNLDNKIAGTGDFNNDGKEDILWHSKADGANYVWTMNGTTLVGTVQLPAETNLSWDICGTGDFNNDGKVDIVWRNRANGSNKVWLMNGIARTSEVSLTTEADLNWSIVGTGDFNGDGKPDILWRDANDGANRIWIMNGTVLVRTEPLSSVNADWEIVGVGDYDSNGKPDIYWRNKVDGRDSVWLMDGLSRQKAEVLAQVTDTTWKIEN